MGRRVAIALLLLLGGALAYAWTAGVLEGLDRERVTQLLRNAGPWGPIGLVLAFALLEPFGVPGALFAIPASWVWPFPLAFALSWLGAVGAGVVGFVFARSIARDFVERKIPARFRRFDERLETRGFVTVVIVRLVFFLAPPAHWVLGVSRVRFTPFVLGTAVGFLPGMAALVLFGEGLLRAWAAAPPGLGAAVGLALAIWILWRRRASRVAGEEPGASTPG